MLGSRHSAEEIEIPFPQQTVWHRQAELTQ